MPDTLLVLAIFLLAGLVKGIAGFGLPTVSLALLALTRPLPEAMALMLAPALFTNIWQAFAGAALRPAIRRLWSFLILAGIGCYLAAGQLARADARTLSGLLGLVLMASTALALGAPRLPAPGRRMEAVLSPVMGAVSGAIAGLTGSFIVPAGPWMQAIRMTREEFVQGFGIGVVIVTLALAAALGGAGLLPAELGLASLAGLVPAFLGMEAGRRIRARLSEERFRRVVQIALGALGLWLAVRAFA
ncbi:MAG TPA: sulfite exporter TauE/SafE family protein [Acetobacteraceae bacterium]|nr:sulfite exporter TauE/SafE family protein [Acetobacteraceae bacterium]